MTWRLRKNFPRWLLNFKPFCGRNNHGLRSPRSRADQTRPQHLPHPSSCNSSGRPDFPEEQKPHITFFPPRLLFRPPNNFVLVLISTTNVSTLVAKSITFLLHYRNFFLSRYSHDVTVPFPSFPPAAIDSFRYFSTPLVAFHAYQLLVPLLQQGCDIVHENLKLWR